MLLISYTDVNQLVCLFQNCVCLSLSLIACGCIQYIFIYIFIHITKTKPDIGYRAYYMGLCHLLFSINPSLFNSLSTVWRESYIQYTLRIINQIDMIGNTN